MQDLTVTLLAYGALFLAYGAAIIAYSLLRKRAYRTISIHPILRLSWWKTIVQCLCAALHAGALAWLIALAHFFAHLTSAMNGTCTTHFKPEECRDAADAWKESYIALILFGVAALCITFCGIFVESQRTAPPPERLYSLGFLTWSHGLLVLSWILCTPFMLPLRVSGLVGTKAWISLSLTIAPFAVGAYTLGVSFWFNAVARVFYGWWRQRGRRSAGEELETDPGRDFVLQDMYP